jgi:hypothetical protein
MVETPNAGEDCIHHHGVTTDEQGSVSGITWFDKVKLGVNGPAQSCLSYDSSGLKTTQTGARCLAKKIRSLCGRPAWYQTDHALRAAGTNLGCVSNWATAGSSYRKPPPSAPVGPTIPPTHPTANHPPLLSAGTTV